MSKARDKEIQETVDTLVKFGFSKKRAIRVAPSIVETSSGIKNRRKEKRYDDFLNKLNSK